MAAATGRALTEGSDARLDEQGEHQSGLALVSHDTQHVYPFSDNAEGLAFLDVPPQSPPQQEPTEPSDEPQPVGVASAAFTGPEAIICRYFDCPKALRVAVCESGDDYYADWDGAHIGTFQLYPGHAWRFEAHGWDYFRDGADIEKNTVIAREVYNDRGWSAWPVCGLR